MRVGIGIGHTKTLAKAAQHASSELWVNPAIREATYATSYAVSAVTAVWRDTSWEKLAKDETLLKKSLNIAIKEEGASKAATLKTFARTTAAVSLFGVLATGLETWESGEKAWDSTYSPIERFGYGLKGASTLAQFTVFLAQFVRNTASFFGLASTSISAIVASWMLTTLMVAGIVYLIAIIIINVFKRSELEKWLLHSTWGKQPKQWNSVEELARLEQIIHRPQVQLNAVPKRKPSQWMDPGTNQWQLEITLPEFTKGANIGLQITRKPEAKTFSYSFLESKSAVLVNEQSGIWSEDDKGNPVYQLELGGTTQDTITVLISIPFGWQISERKQLLFLASGDSEGSLPVSPETEQFATRIIKVGSK